MFGNRLAACFFFDSNLINVLFYLYYFNHYFTENSWVLLLDDFNLIIHEAGHPITSLISNNLAVYGGTLFQLIFPFAFACHFWRQRHSAGWMVSLVWLGENMMNVGLYMKDARAQELPLLGGGEHDWLEIFSRWGVLNRDVYIGNVTRFLGLCIALFATIWLWKQWRRMNR